MSAVVKVKQRRADRLGASDAPVVLGLVAMRGPIDVWLRMTGRQPPPVANDAMRFGTDYEPIIRARYVESSNKRVWVPSESLLHPTIDFIQATPDGIALKNTTPDIVDPTWIPEREHWAHLLEVKAPHSRQRADWGDDSAEMVPAHVLVQCAVQMMVCDLPFVDVAAEIDREYVQRRVHRDPALEQDIIEGLTEFWGHVKNDTPPPVDATDSYAEYLKNKLEKAAATIEASPVVDKILGDWKQAEIDKKDAETRVDLAKNRFMDELVKLNAAICKSEQHGVIRMQAGAVKYDDKALAGDLCTRLQLRGEVVDIDAERMRFRKQGSPFPRRPNAWTKE